MSAASENKPVNHKNIGKRIRMRRVELGYTQEYLAEQVGIAPTYCSILECNYVIPSLDVLVRIANALRICTNNLVYDQLLCNDAEFAGKKILAMLYKLNAIMEKAYYRTSTGAIVMDYAKLGYRVKQYRVRRELTQESLAKQVGISASFLGHIERGSRKASVETLISIANALSVRTDHLLLDSLDYFELSTTPEMKILKDRLEQLIQYVNESLENSGGFIT